jgi:hypothetical protein
LVPSTKTSKSKASLPVQQLQKVTAENLWRAVHSLRDGFKEHGFKHSTEFDLLLPDGTRLDPKAVFGIAATEALGFEVTPKHFASGFDTYCFRALRAAGFNVVPKGASVPEPPPPQEVDREWVEGTPRQRQHYRRERAAGLREAKKAEFRRNHVGALFCERCKIDPTETYALPEAEACLEVHHHRVQVSDMEDGHVTKLEDLLVLCANCHRLEHRLMRLAESAKEETGSP